MAFNRENRSDAPFRKRGGFHDDKHINRYIGYLYRAQNRRRLGIRVP